MRAAPAAPGQEAADDKVMNHHLHQHLREEKSATGSAEGDDGAAQQSGGGSSSVDLSEQGVDALYQQQKGVLGAANTTCSATSSTSAQNLSAIVPTECMRVSVPAREA